MRRDLAVLLLILTVAFGLRVVLPWQVVFVEGRVDFLENDAWYHIRLIENQVRNWPWRVSLDPYAAPGGQFVPIAPLFDTITATIALVLHGRDATALEIERIAAFVPPILGTLAVLAVWALCRRVFDPSTALVSAALLAILPGHFLDRTLLGFYDHHALEAALAIATLLALMRALAGDAVAGRGGSAAGRLVPPALAGVALGCYLLGWSGGALLVGILIVWLTLLVALTRSSEERARAARVCGVAAVVALVLVFAFQDARMFRYDSQILALAAFGGLALVVWWLDRRALWLVALGAAAVAGAVIAGYFAQVLTDITRLTPDARRMGVLEARPLFLYTGTWNWLQPWEFFRTGFYVGLIGLALFTGRVWRARQPADLLIWVFGAAIFAATYGQNRFGYYLMPVCAIFGGWLATRLIEWGGPARRPLTVALVAAVIFAPNLVPTSLSAARASALGPYWRDAMQWLRDRTPPPFTAAGDSAGHDYYHARYPRESAPAPDYSVMNWWDHGYWIVQLARRVPVANPTQERAPNAARFYASTSEADAMEILRREGARYVISDWELPFRLTPEGTVMGRFQNVLDWAGARHAGFYEVMYRRQMDTWIPVWVFHEPYYRSMAYRLSVLGGAAATPVDATSVISVGERLDNTGFRFKEITSMRTFPRYAAAVDAAKAPVDTDRVLVVGLDPWRSAFPLEALTRFEERQSFRAAGQRFDEAPFVRIFEVQ